MSDVDGLIERRGMVHGDFTARSKVAQAIKKILHEHSMWPHSLNDAQKQSLDEIAGKISRIMEGDPNEPDHWDDIAGYAMLVANTLRVEVIDGDERPADMFECQAGPTGMICPCCHRRTAAGGTMFADNPSAPPSKCLYCINES